jgi:pyruvate dehydrogenase E1 component beta subunit
MERDERVFMIGQGFDTPWSVGTSTLGLTEKYGKHRVIDPPIAENAMTGLGVGAALAGLRPIVVHPRMDFTYLAMDQIMNHAAKWHYMFGGQVKCPLTIRTIINKGNEQAAQHSQCLQSVYAHIPGLKVVMPGTPYDAKGLLIASVLDDNPVIYIDDRWLYDLEGPVPEEFYSVPIGKGEIRTEGKDLTIVTYSYMLRESLKAAEKLEEDGISVEIIDIRSLKPLDTDLILSSLRKTKRLIIAEGGNRTCGFGAEIAARVAESDLFNKLEAPIKRITFPDTPAPASSTLEKSYYTSWEDVVSAGNQLINS